MSESEPRNACVEKTIALVFETFCGVTREGGVSWSESRVLDMYGSQDEQRTARLKDREPGWEALTNDPDWEPIPGTGGFTFLDPVGFRYYLPAAMVKRLRGHYGRTGELHYQLGLTEEFRDFSLKQWSSLQPEEIQCVCEFLKCMIAVGDDPPDLEVGYSGDDSWARAYRSHWVKLDDNPLPE